MVLPTNRTQIIGLVRRFPGYPAIPHSNDVETRVRLSDWTPCQKNVLCVYQVTGGVLDACMHITHDGSFAPDSRPQLYMRDTKTHIDCIIPELFLPSLPAGRVHNTFTLVPSSCTD